MPPGLNLKPSPRTQAASLPTGSRRHQQTDPAPAAPSLQTPPAIPPATPQTPARPLVPTETRPRRCTPFRSRWPRPPKPSHPPSFPQAVDAKHSFPDPATRLSTTPPDWPPTAASPARCAMWRDDRAGRSFRARSQGKLAGGGRSCQRAGHVSPCCRLIRRCPTLIYHFDESDQIALP